jgi:glycosyltransferase involved in cell wall biosynthesis
MKILELSIFSAGICGVWQRVKQESVELSKNGHEVYIFSSNAVKDSDNLAPLHENMDGIPIRRFPFKKLGGESFMYWDFTKPAMKLKPDIIIAHSYRHPHTTKALKIANKLKKQGHKCRVFLVTHAPFVEKDHTRSFFSKHIVRYYDKMIGPGIINKFDKVIAITKWEINYLRRLGCQKEKISYIPNGLPEEFFNRKTRKGKNLFFLGRITEIKNLECLLQAIALVNDKKIKLRIIGPVESSYRGRLKFLIKKLKIEKKVIFAPPVFNLNNKINKMDSFEIFVLPSKREAMPQALIEAMARGKIVISSKTQGGLEIINDKKNGFLFDINNPQQLAGLIEKILKMSEKEKNNLRQKARDTAKKFQWKKLIKDLESLF